MRMNAFYLQNEYEVVDRFAPLIEEVLRRSFVIVVELQFLDDIWMLEDPQEDFFCDLERAEQTHL